MRSATGDRSLSLMIQVVHQLDQQVMLLDSVQAFLVPVLDLQGDENPDNDQQNLTDGIDKVLATSFAKLKAAEFTEDEEH
jgi:hypothetical protein